MTTYLALGSNIGDRRHHLETARRRLSETSTTEIISAPLYETDPLDCPPESPAFLNTVLSLETDLSAEELLRVTQRIEAELGRETLSTRMRNAPRPVDIDLLLYGDEVITTPNLIIPHPRLHERRFVLSPLRDLAPALVPPTHANPVAILLELITSDELAPVKVAEQW